MKKSLKAWLGASLLAALLIGCSNGGYVANDVLDKADLNALVTESGVAVISWQPVKDATNYKLYVMEPGTEDWKPIYENRTNNNWMYNTITYSNGDVVTLEPNDQFYKRRVVAYNVNKLDKEYTFKLVAISDYKSNLLSSEVEVSVDTPEAWVDTAAPSADSLELNLVANTLNKYTFACPVDNGFTYTWKIVKTTAGASENAKDLFYSTEDFNGEIVEGWTNSSGDTEFSVGAWLNDRWGEDYIPVLDDDDNVLPMEFATFVLPDNDVEYRVVLKMNPVNEKVATPKYILSSKSIKFDSTGIVSAPEDCAVTTKNATTKVLTFTADKYKGTEMAASNYRIYQLLTTTTKNSDLVYTGTTKALTLLGSPAKDTDLVTTRLGYVQYKLEASVKEAPASGIESYSYDFFVAYTDVNGNVSWYKFY